MIMYFAKDQEGWFISYNAPKKERAMVLGADTWLSKIKEKNNAKGDDVVKLAVETAIMKDDDYLSPRFKKLGWSALYKQAEAPSGGATYNCPSLQGDIINHYLWLPKIFSKFFGGYPEIIYFQNI